MREDEFYMWLGKYIKEVRMRSGKTQHEICLAYRLSRSSLSNIETGRHRLSIYSFYELLCILDEPFENVIDSMLTFHRQKNF
ncbi:transcriptional regulator with XRE-family HTH domain [Paenibacillus phyllosphaerae]|uniref:Transcriptional regulator with XRE-family HTH domain n=1 Tax=Paenibacillus phyllosphaerae TaxID=274593 RepID=A0A7W5B2Y0_9BACL|nr:transcriptional regulator with XRE-family HTH domain [Paenibacillus phyllosphaerae]